MVACLIELSCSIAPLSFSCFWTRAIPFLSFFFIPLLFCSKPLCYCDGVFEMYLTEREVCARYPLSGFFYLVLFVLSHPTIGLTNGDTSKATSKMTWAIFYLISPQQTTIPGHCHCLLFEWQSQFCDPSRHFAFYWSPFNPCFRSAFCLRLSVHLALFIPVH